MIWNSSSAVQLDTNSGGIAHLCDIRFRYLGGSTSLSFDNSSFNGKNCEYSDNNGDPMIDTPTINHYICGYITHYPYPSQPVPFQVPRSKRKPIGLFSGSGFRTHISMVNFYIFMVPAVQIQ